MHILCHGYIGHMQEVTLVDLRHQGDGGDFNVCACWSNCEHVAGGAAVGSPGTTVGSDAARSFYKTRTIDV